MPDWAIKIFQSALTSKKALQIGTGIVLIFIIWPIANKLAAQQKIPEPISTGLILLGSLCVGLLVINLLELVWKRLCLLPSYIKSKFISKKEAEEFRKKIKSSLPSLPKEQQIILLALQRGENKINSRSSGVFWLEHHGYVERVVQLEHESYVYKINKVVDQELSLYVEQKKKA